MTEGKGLVVIVGLQKSGTSLLIRLLEQVGLARNPFRGEGAEFWGDVPPINPVAFPAGALYQAHEGRRGHELDDADATPDVVEHLRRGVREARRTPGEVLVTKNPYNSVRVAWVRAALPRATIVAVVRAAVPNAYSLAKKYVPHEQRGRPPEQGWWGVKPAGWERLVGEDKLVQSARQWVAVNDRLFEAPDQLDVVIDYARLCAEPAQAVAAVAAAVEVEGPDAVLPALRCHDGEYRTGSRLRSKNRYYRERGDLETPASEPIEFPALSDEEVAAVERIAAPTAARLRACGQPVEASR